MDTDNPLRFVTRSPAIAYREHRYRPDGEIARWIENHFDVVARPGQTAGPNPEEGDLLLQVTLGQLDGGRCVRLDGPALSSLRRRGHLLNNELLLRPREPIGEEAADEEQQAEPGRAQTHIFFGTPFITVASPSQATNDEWVRRRGSRVVLPPPVHQDYAVMKVLYTLRDEVAVPVQQIAWDNRPVPLDFSRLRDADIIYVVGHGDHGGLYALGPRPEDRLKRLVDSFVADGNLGRKRRGKQLVVSLLSCRAGLGFHQAFARALHRRLGGVVDVVVGGAIGFTYGSIRTRTEQQNEVLIEGLPWYMEYPNAEGNNRAQAERKTSQREGRAITYAGKRHEIEKFGTRARELETEMRKVITSLRSTEVNAALSELQRSRQRDWWLTLIWEQQKHYQNARTDSGLGYDMWFPDLAEAYHIVRGSQVNDATVAALLAAVGDPPPGPLISER